MVQSMTGFGQAHRSVNGLKLQIDMKSVNHRYSEVMVRMPREWLMFEDLLKKTVLQFIKRGRVDMFVTIEYENTSEKLVEVDWSLAEQYVKASDQLRDQLGLQGELSIAELMKLPEVVFLKDNLSVSAEMLEAALKQCALDAVQQLSQMRGSEGAQLYNDLLERMNHLAQYIEDIEQNTSVALKEYRAKLNTRLQELLGDTKMDETRLSMEVALLAERSNIDEELTRLKSHRTQFMELLHSSEPAGRKMDFLIQEMNREINTIGSKSSYQPIVSIVVEVKAELEKIREQVQNIE